MRRKVSGSTLQSFWMRMSSTAMVVVVMVVLMFIMKVIILAVMVKVNVMCTVYPKKYAHGFCFAVLCCGYTLTDLPISIRLTSLALWQSNDCPSASKATLMNMDRYFMWIHYERLHNHNKAKPNKTVCIFLGIYCMLLEHIKAYSTYHCFWTKPWIKAQIDSWLLFDGGDDNDDWWWWWWW